MIQTVIRSATQLAQWRRVPVPAKFVGVDFKNAIINRPTITFSGELDQNQGGGLLFEGCKNFQIIDPVVICGSTKPVIQGGSRYGIVFSDCHNAVVRGGGIFEDCHSFAMVCDGSTNIQIGDTDNVLTTQNCWMGDVHGGGCKNIRFYNIFGDCRIHIGNITPSLLRSGSEGCVVHGCNVAAVEVAGLCTNAKVYGTVAREFRLYPASGLPFNVRLEDVGEAAIVTKLFNPETGQVVG